MDNSQHGMTPSLIIHGVVLHMSHTCLWYCMNRNSCALDSLHLRSREISVGVVISFQGVRLRYRN